MAAGPAAHATPSKSRGHCPHRPPCPARRYRRTAARHGRQRPGARRAAQRLAPAAPGHPGRVRRAAPAARTPRRSSPRSPGPVSWSSSPVAATARCCPRLPQPAAVSWAWPRARLACERSWRAWTGPGPAAAPARRRSGPAARPCCWRPAARKPGRPPWPSPARRARPASLRPRRAVRGVPAGAAARRGAGRHHRQHPRPGRAAR